MAAKKISKDIAEVVEREVPDAPQDEVITIEAEEKTVEKKAPVLKDGVYTEYDVELVNGVKVPISVIVDRKKLPSTFGSLISEGNAPALVIAQLTPGTRRIVDLAGATMEDTEITYPPVIQRANDAADAEKSE